MAGLLGLKVVLLWAGIICLANCADNKNESAPSPTRTVATTIATASITTVVPSSSLTLSPPTSNTSFQTKLSTTITGILPTSTSDLSLPASTSPSTPSIPQTNTQNQAAPTLNNPNTTKADSAAVIPASDTSDQSLPAPTSSTTSVVPQNQTTTPLKQSNTTVAAPTTAGNQTTAGPSPTSPQCFYQVQLIPGGFLINMTNSPAGNYNITITENNQTVKQENVFVSNETSTHEIKHLKPCTEYEHSVVRADRQITCNSDANKAKTQWNDDIKEISNTSGYVCYQSAWNLDSSVSTPKNHRYEQREDGKFCFKLADEDFCSDFNITFTPENCNVTFNRTRYISVDFIDPNAIVQHEPTGLPAKIEPKLLSNCKNVMVDYTCSESGKVNQFIKLSDVEPFTNYTCTGLIQHNSVSIKTLRLQFQTICDLTITDKKVHRTNTSTELTWKTTSNNCKGFPQNFTRFSYTSYCPKPPGTGPCKSIKPDGGKCELTRLSPYTDYTCEIQPTYNDSKVSKPETFTWKTEPGTPETVTIREVSNPENNVIKISCTHNTKKFYGPKHEYIAHLVGGSTKNETSCDFEFKDLSYLKTYTLEVVAFNGVLKSKPVTKQVHTRYNDKAVIGFLVFLIILTSVALLVVVYKIYILRSRKSHDQNENLRLIDRGSDEDNLLLVEPISSEVLLETYKRKLADEARLFLAEFQSIPRIFSRYTVKEAKKACNGPKNRYVDILPYDYNRVQLTTGNGDAGCDYINGSFIDGYKEPKKYIAAQGPKDETVSDFWRMVWEQQSSIIVMVTRCEEGNRVKCAQYWPSPERETEIFEEFIVKLTSEDHCPDYTIRHLTLTNKREKNSEREVTHIQFMSWPDHGVPGEPQLLLKLRRRVNAFKNFFSGPIVVHCSAGVGRTGTYIGIDAMMEGLEAEGRVDIYGYVVRLRRQRCLMVQVEAQYILIHQALLEYNQFGETEITLAELHSTIKELKQKNSDNEPTLMEEEFERLPTFKNWRTFNTGISEENKNKNRSSSVIPYDFNRVLLKLDEGHSQDSDPDEDEEDESSDEEDEDSTKYINASHIDGYWGQRAFIAAQTPLPDTTDDFWLMVYQKKASAIVMLSDSSEGDKDSDSVYWDANKKTFGDVEVEVTNKETSATFITRSMLIRHVKRKESRTVAHFQFLKWENKDLPEKSQDFINMIKDIKHNYGDQIQRSMPVVVHCTNGSSRSGIFCALWNLLDSAETEKLVDVFQVVKTLRKERQGMLSSLEHYQFLYSALEGAFPVQNGEVKQVHAAAADRVQIVNETKAEEQPVEVKAEQPASTTSTDQQGAAELTSLLDDGGEKEKKEEPKTESSAPSDTKPLEDTSNGPVVTVEI
ncbi:receptor-type tyrosine-protein phosphatase C isoform X3 [Melanotaenia boesemani]|uniref:receptor-type tyrosine-protein phosphatase C isoform X3 n=1 Tax=Melanotaenia boesemani TaxID=1250792 RepID=UPI001C04F6F2|nr:receptor-type tyrosine-protein phosphatase C isoform X3 [Melanotaenia boesemani]